MEVKEAVDRLEKEVASGERRLEQEEQLVQQRSASWLEAIGGIAEKLNDKFSTYMNELNYAGRLYFYLYFIISYNYHGNYFCMAILFLSCYCH